jgi:hypothetical protein
MSKLIPKPPPTVEASRLGRLDVLRDALAEISGRKTTLESEIEMRQRRREELLALPLPIDDAIALVEEHVDRSRAAFARVTRSVLSFLPERYWAEMPSHVDFLRITGSREIEGIALSYVLGAALKQCLASELRTWTWPAVCGPARGERTREIARLDAEIERLDAELAALTQAAKDAGVRL